jgi:hypothetical protein
MKTLVRAFLFWFHLLIFVRLRRTNILIFTLVLISGLSACGQIFVASSRGSYVGEYALNGSPLNAMLIPGLGYPWGMTMGGVGDLYVANEGSRSVGKYTLSGTTINGSLVTVRGDPEGVALDGSGSLYVVDGYFNTVGKYTTSGTAVNASLITGLSGGGFASIACDGTSLYVANSSSGKIAKYTTTGTLINPDLISIGDVYSLACDENGNLFVAADGVVGKYSTSGAVENASLITGVDARMYGINFDSSGDIFVSNFSRGTIGEYTASGATINASLVTGLNEPMGIVVVPEPSSFAVLGAAGFLAFWVAAYFNGRTDTLILVYYSFE